MSEETNPLLRVRVGDTVHTIDRLTLGDWRVLKTEFGLDVPDIFLDFTDAQGEERQILNFGDPNVLVGLLTIALHHERPKAPVKTLIAEVEAVGMDEFEFVGPDAPEKSEDPTKGDEDEDDASAVIESPVKAGKSAKRPKEPGTRS